MNNYGLQDFYAIQFFKGFPIKPENIKDVIFYIRYIVKQKLGAKNEVDFFHNIIIDDSIIRKAKRDQFHNFPSSVDWYQKEGTIIDIIGRKGDLYKKLKIEGWYKCGSIARKGVFEYIKDSHGHIKHRCFKYF